MAIPSFLGSHRVARQISAVGSLREINTAEDIYASTYNTGYSPNLSTLGPRPGAAQPTAKAAILIDSALASGRRSLYTFTYTPGLPDASGKITNYTIIARSVCAGDQNFFTDQSGVIHWTRENRPPTARDATLE